LIANGVFHVFGKLSLHPSILITLVAPTRNVLLGATDDSRLVHLDDPHLGFGGLWQLAQQGGKRLGVDAMELSRDRHISLVHHDLGE